MRAFFGLPRILDLIGLPVLGVLLLWSLLRHGRRSELLPGFWQRFRGSVPRLADDRPVVWFHAVSVGEALLCRPVLQRLTAARPDLQFALSVSTPDGYAVARSQITEATVFWAPWDFTWAVRRVFAALQPCALVIAENDFWPSMLAEARRQRVPLAIFNTRMSRREQLEHRLNGWLLRDGLNSASWWGAVSEQDAMWVRRFFGAATATEVTGSLKFDGIVRDRHTDAARRLRADLGFGASDRVLVAGSTHAPEEEWLAAVAQQLVLDFPALKLVIVPRHPGRDAQMARSLERTGATVGRRNGLGATGQPPALITLFETVGVLRDLWSIADYAFVGGSLVRRGGQNMAEPASFGVPMCFGPHVGNFQQMAAEFLAAGAAVEVRSAADLAACLRTWLSDPDEALRLGLAARDVVAAQTNPLEATVRGILSVLPPPGDARHDASAAALISEGAP